MPTGHCLCGAITLSVQATPLISVICHCRDCQRNAGGPVQALAVFPTSDVTTNDPAGVLQTYTIPGSQTGSGLDKDKTFCGRCGCPVATFPGKFKGERTVLRTAMFDDATTLWPPTQEWFAKDRVPFMEPLTGLKQVHGQGAP